MKQLFSWRTVLAGYLIAARRFFIDRGLVPMLLIGPVIYGFYYPWSMVEDQVRQVPVAIVDYDNSALSRRLIRYAAASPNLELVAVRHSEQPMHQAMLNGAIAAYAVIPPDLTAKVLQHKKASVEIFTTGSYALWNKAAAGGFHQAFATVSAEIEIKKNYYKGVAVQLGKEKRTPINYSTIALFNPLEGYASYLVPAVFLLIVHQMLMLCVACSIGTWCEQKQLPQTLAGWVGLILFFCSLGWYAAMVLFGWFFEFHNYPRGENIGGVILMLLLLMPTLCAYGTMLGLSIGNREQPMQVMVFSSILVLFVSGYVWPPHLLPEVLQWLRWLIPNTAAVNASLKLSQMGGGLADVRFELTVLFTLMLLSFAGVTYMVRQRNKQATALAND